PFSFSLSNDARLPLEPMWRRSTAAGCPLTAAAGAARRAPRIQMRRTRVARIVGEERTNGIMVNAPREPAPGQLFRPKGLPQKMSQVPGDRTARGPGASGTTVESMIARCSTGTRCDGEDLRSWSPGFRRRKPGLQPRGAFQQETNHCPAGALP